FLTIAVHAMPKLHSYRSLELYHLVKNLTLACYSLSHNLPAEEKTNLGYYLRNAAITIYVQVAQGAFMRSKKQKKKHIRSTENALIIIESLMEILVEVGFAKEEQTNEIIKLSSACYQLLGEL
ncbi:MAG TPA: four helix bundle protein, partial [Flavisolibacter sp.]|nr:four helix bundle protein [Flavisolibacter sp.]